MTASASSFDAVVDPRLPFPNIGGVPLFLSPRPLDEDTIAAITHLHTRARAASTLAGYADYAVLDEDTSPAAHHLLICDAIDRLIADEYDDLVINTPPGAAKSTYTSHALGAYYMGRFPTRSIILATHTGDLSEKWSRKVRNTFADRRHLELFPASTLSKDSTAVSRWATSLGGEFLAAGVGASILGFRADCAIIDDPISGFEQAQSLTQLTKVHDWFETDLITRLKPSGKIVLICQRLSPNDLAGYMIHRHALNPTRRLKLLILRMEAQPTPDQPDPLNRQPGERLWPEWYTPEMVQDAKRDEFKWRTLYQQEPPSDTGSWVSADDIQFRPSPPLTSNSRRYGLTDLALSVNTGDYTVHIIVEIDQEGDWDIVEAQRDRCDPSQSAATLTSLAALHSPVEWLIDDDNASKVFMPLVATRARQTSTNVPWRPLPLRGQDKETRAAPLRGQFKRRKVFLPAAAPFTSWLTRQILEFPNATGSGVDDGIDALSLLGRRMMALSTPSAPPAAKRLPTTAEMTLDDLWADQPNPSTARI